MGIKRNIARTFLSLFILAGMNASALDVAATVAALRLSSTITGGTMPNTDPLFAQMVEKVAAGDHEGAAAIAINSRYGAKYLARRMALQMQTPALDANVGIDNDATAFLIAKLVGTPTIKPSISTIWSENATYLVNNGTANVRAAALTPAQLNAVDWTTALVRQDGQQVQVRDAAGNVALGDLPVKHVGGYTTLSDRRNDQSFAMYGATAGTNLRYIEGIWEIGTGLTLIDVASTAALAQDVPRFVPAYDPNFFVGQGQTACIACHGGGLSSLNHGYSTVADVFDFTDNNGFTFISVPSTNTRKSLGSDPGRRNANLTCNLTRTPLPTCNPDSVGTDPNHGWNLTKTWQQTGVLNAMGWTGPTSGQGLNELGAALGKARIVYEYLTKRIVKEVCPLGTFSASRISQIAAAANPYAPVAGTDDFRTLVAKVASDPSCQ